MKGRYSADAALIFYSWLKDVDMYVWERKYNNIDAVQLVKDYAVEHAQGVVKFYLDMHKE